MLRLCDAGRVSDERTASGSPAVVAAIVPAAGSGTRLAADEADPGAPKALRLLAGEPLLRHAVRSLAHVVAQVVVPAAPGQLDAVRSALGEVGARVEVVEGGATRQESVRRALAALDPATELVLVHDAARPLAPAAVAERVVVALQDGAEAVAPAVAMADTLRQLRADGTSQTLDRATVRAVQTPQGFTLEVLRRAHAAADHDLATDDASMAERLGVAVRLVEGDVLSFKVTRAIDLVLAEALLAGQSAT
jgi:2-C-methyl-D-erythritol 4-phosphate cytidylyltransferase